jgi:hypothetical protein
MSVKYLQAFADGEAFPGGLAHREALQRLKLDYSRDSLERIDGLLDRIRASHRLSYGAFLNLQSNQNFLYLLCFYVGATIAQCSGQAIEWLDYEQMRRRIPGNETMFPRCFATSITCLLQKRGFFVPLLSIEDRLFNDVPEKSVRFSAEGFM